VRRALVLLAAALSFAAAGVAFAPASLVDAQVAQRTQQRLRVVDATGYWWHGRGAVATADGAVRVPIGWRVDVGALVRGRWVIELAGSDAAAPRAIVAMHESRVDIRDLRLTVPASIVSSLDPRLKDVALGGRLSIDVRTLTRAASVAADVGARWERAAIATRDVAADLGSVALATTSPEPFAGTLRNDGGDVAVDGQVRVQPNGVDVGAVLRARPALSDGARRMLPLLGAPDAGGVRVDWHVGQ
jgi:hypothetical protein